MKKKAEKKFTEDHRFSPLIPHYSEIPPVKEINPGTFPQKEGESLTKWRKRLTAMRKARLAEDKRQQVLERRRKVQEAENRKKALEFTQSLVWQVVPQDTHTIKGHVHQVAEKAINLNKIGNPDWQRSQIDQVKAKKAAKHQKKVVGDLLSEEEHMKKALNFVRHRPIILKRHGYPLGFHAFYYLEQFQALEDEFGKSCFDILGNFCKQPRDIGFRWAWHFLTALRHSDMASLDQENAVWQFKKDKEFWEKMRPKNSDLKERLTVFFKKNQKAAKTNARRTTTRKPDCQLSQ